MIRIISKNDEVEKYVVDSLLLLKRRGWAERKIFKMSYDIKVNDEGDVIIKQKTKKITDNMIRELIINEFKEAGFEINKDYEVVFNE